MQSSTARHDNSYIPLGERRGKSDLARFSLDLSWARAVSDSARSRAYPSPPMSGSPPLPPRRNPDSSDRGHGSYGSSGQDVSRGMHTPQMEQSEQRGPSMQGYPPNTAPPALYPGSYRAENMLPAQQHYQQLPQIPSQQQPHLGYASLPPQSSATFSASERPPIREGPEFSSPKQQRKTKGHVASACVPCKKAHLRCDAQRPCSRCLSNGKEDTCIDVQHKKRGRPRLRDERESRYEGVAPGYPPSHHEATIRRPISLYSPSEGPSYSDPHRSNSYRVLKSQAGSMMGGQLPPRYLDHASPTDATIYGQPMPLTPRTVPMQEPACAYLTMEMQIAKATSSFSETIGLQSVFSRKLQDIVSPAEREKVARLQRVFEDERREREPNYLPPIYLAKFEEDRVIQSVGFSAEEIGQARTDRQEMLTFQAPDGQQRTFQLRLGLAKRESTYFVVALLHVLATPQSFQQPSSSPFSRETHSRDSQYGYQNTHAGYAQTPGMSPFGPNPGFGDLRGEMTTFRTPGPLGQNIPSSTAVPQYAQLQARPEYSQAQVPYQTPRSEMQPQAQRQDNLQLPPIRDPSSAMEPTRRRDDRSGRVDIGGLLEKPDPARRKG